jgi:hypothetical protein
MWEALMKQTKHERAVAWVLHMGAREVKSNSKKYRKFETKTTGRFYFVGKVGAVRVGSTIADSTSLTDAIGALK